MTLRADSYGSVAEVLTYSRYIRDGQSTFNSTTRPTLTEVEKFIDRASSVLNLALAKHGFTVPVSNSTAKLTLDDWVVAKAAEMIELTQPGASFSDKPNDRANMFRRMSGQAENFVTDNARGFKFLGAGVSHKASEGLVFTGETAQIDRSDPDDTSLPQPMFRRHQFSDNTVNQIDDDWDED